MQFSDLNTPLNRPDRPVGVILLTLWDGLMLGLLPLVRDVFGLLRQGPGQSGLELLLCNNVGLPVIVMFLSIGTFMGYDRARVALIYAIVVQQSLIAFGHLVGMAGGALPMEAWAAAFFGILFAFFWIFLNAWYFLRPATLEFYRRPKSLRGG